MLCFLREVDAEQLIVYLKLINKPNLIPLVIFPFNFSSHTTMVCFLSCVFILLKSSEYKLNLIKVRQEKGM